MKLRARFAILYLYILYILAGTLHVAAQSATTASPAAAAEAVERFVSSRGIAPGSVAVLITNVADGHVIASHNPGRPLIPASITKAVTTATLLEHASIDRRLPTELIATGPVDGGVLEGNLIVRGSGDPSLNSTEGPYTPDFIEECIAAMRSHGIDSVAGRIVADETIFPSPSTPPSWDPADLRHSYGAGCFGINFENNSTGRRSVSHPASVLQTRLLQAMQRAGIGLGNNSMRQGEEHSLHTHLSAPLDEIMRSCMVRSDNLYAEAMLRLYALESTGKGATAAGAESERNYWQGRGAGAEGVHIVDGSGLSRQNRLTAKFLTDVLLAMHNNANYASFFPLAGQEGTLKSFLRDTPLDSYIALKTGSMNGIQCYAGYKLDDDYAPTHTVVIIINDMKGSRANVKNAAADMLLSIFAPDAANPPAEQEEE